MTLRAGDADDAALIAKIHRAACTPAIPNWPDLHTPEEDVAFFGARVLPVMRVTMAMADEAAAGFIAFTDDWVHHIYILPDFWRVKLGTLLLAEAKSHANALQLWTFQSNARARAFYAREGFREVEWTDGSRNEERLPDVRLEWRRIDQG